MKEVKNKFRGATVNDILTAVLNMMLRRYLIEVDDPVLRNPSALVRGNFPINMRKPDSEIQLGNNFSAGSFTYDLEYESRIDLVWRVKRQLDAIKASPKVFMNSTKLY